LANIESGRTPLRFDIAIRLAILTGFSLKWIAEGVEPQKIRIKIGESLLAEIPRNCLFSVAWQQWMKRPFEAAEKKAKAWISSKPEGASLTDAPVTVGDQADVGFAGANDVLSYLTEDFRGFLKLIPPHLLQGFYAQIINAGRDFVGVNIFEIHEWEARVADDQKKHQVGLDIQSGVADKEGVKGKIRSLPGLINRLRALTKLRGQKAVLARKFKVSRQAVDQWLSGSTNPSAETTLKLVEWVEQQEHRPET